MAIVNDSHKKAVKAAVAQMALGGHSLHYIADSVSDVVREMGLQAGDLHSVNSLFLYAKGCQDGPNGKWELSFHENLLKNSIVLRADLKVLDYLGAF